MPEWTQGFIRSIEPVNKDAISEGDKLKVTLESASFSPVILVSTDSKTKEKNNKGRES